MCEAECDGHTDATCVAGKCKIYECGLNCHPLCCRGQDYSNPCQARCEGGVEFPLLTCQHGTC